MSFFERLGQAKAIYGRSGMYISVVNFVMLVYLTVKDPAVQPWHMALALGALVAIVLLDVRYVFRHEMSYVMEKTPQMVSIERKLDAVLAKIKRFEEMLG